MTKFTAPTCSGQQEVVYLYLDDELPPDDRAAFEQHLATCPACQKLLARSEMLFAEVASLATVTVPEPAVSVAAGQVMARLPRTQKVERFSLPALLLLAAQLTVGLGLLAVTLPRLIPLYPAMLRVPARIEMSILLENIRFWIGSSGNLISIWLTGQWRELVDLSLFNVSPQVAFVALAGFGLAWLLTNNLLLRRPAPSMRNGGTS